VRLLAVAISSLLALAACGGSASETPWPSEPEDVDLGPIGESQHEDATPRAKSSASADASSSAAPSEEAPMPRQKKVDPTAP
jgi:hypothetical protein